MKYSNRSTNKSHTSRSKLILLILAGILLFAGGVYAYHFTTQDDANETSATDETDSETQIKERDAEKKEEAITPDGDESDDEAKPDQSRSADENGDTTKQVKLSLSQNSNNEVIVQSEVSGITSGVCKLQINNNNVRKSYEAELMFQPEFSTCAGFSIPVSDLGTGTWNINLEIISNGTALASEKSSIEVK